MLYTYISLSESRLNTYCLFTFDENIGARVAGLSKKFWISFEALLFGEIFYKHGPIRKSKSSGIRPHQN